jgi:hypothetical protein
MNMEDKPTEKREHETQQIEPLNPAMWAESQKFVPAPELPPKQPKKRKRRRNALRYQ